MKARVAVLVLVAGLALTGCDRGTDQLGSLEASVDAVSRQVDADAAG